MDAERCVITQWAELRATAEATPSSASFSPQEKTVILLLFSPFFQPTRFVWTPRGLGSVIPVKMLSQRLVT